MATLLPRVIGQALANGAGQTAGDDLQGQLGGQTYQGPAPEGGHDGTTMPLTEQYNREQSGGNQFYPPGDGFMGGGVWLGGNLTSRTGVSAETLQPAVQALSDPSNPDAPGNRQLLGNVVSGLGAATSVGAAFVPHPVARMGLTALGTGMNVVGGMITGSEQRAQQQASEVPRQPIPDDIASQSPQQIQAGYQQVSQDYSDHGFGPQGDVTRVLQPTPQNASISRGIHGGLRGTDSFTSPPADSSSSSPPSSSDGHSAPSSEPSASPASAQSESPASSSGWGIWDTISSIGSWLGGGSSGGGSSSPSGGSSHGASEDSGSSSGWSHDDHHDSGSGGSSHETVAEPSGGGSSPASSHDDINYDAFIAGYSSDQPASSDSTPAQESSPSSSPASDSSTGSHDTYEDFLFHTA